MRARIIIDNLDAAYAPDSPLTLNVYRDVDDGTESREMTNPQDQAVIGSDIPTMLRELANAWETHPPEIDDDETGCQCSDPFTASLTGHGHGCPEYSE